jgi:hypothetical protein
VQTVSNRLHRVSDPGCKPFETVCDRSQKKPCKPFQTVCTEFPTQAANRLKPFVIAVKKALQTVSNRLHRVSDPGCKPFETVCDRSQKGPANRFKPFAPSFRPRLQTV